MKKGNWGTAIMLCLAVVMFSVESVSATTIYQFKLESNASNKEFRLDQGGFAHNPALLHRHENNSFNLWAKTLNPADVFIHVNEETNSVERFVVQNYYAKLNDFTTGLLPLGHLSLDLDIDLTVLSNIASSVSAPSHAPISGQLSASIHAPIQNAGTASFSTLYGEHATNANVTASYAQTLECSICVGIFGNWPGIHNFAPFLNGENDTVRPAFSAWWTIAGLGTLDINGYLSFVGSTRPNPPAAVPEPTSIALLGAGLFGLTLKTHPRQSIKQLV